MSSSDKTTNIPSTFPGANVAAAAAVAAATTTIDEKKPSPAYHYHAVRTCKGLDGPVIFLKETDAHRFLTPDKSSVHERFSNLEDADEWLGGKKKSRKRKSMDDLDTNIKPVPAEIIEKNDHIWEQKFQELKTFTETIGDGNPNLVMQKEYRVPQLQAWMSGQRRNYARYINNEVNEARSHFDRRDRFYKLLELGVKLKTEEIMGSWKETALKWRAFTSDDPSIILPVESSDEKIAELAQWQNRQIMDYVKMTRKEQPHEMYPHRLKLLREWDFPFPKDVHPPKKVLKTFDERLQEFINWKGANGGSPMVPQSIDALGEWVKEQRKEHRKKITGKKTCMTDERLAKLVAAGFVFRIRTPRKSGASRDEEKPAAAGPLVLAPAQVPPNPNPQPATAMHI